MEKQLIKKGFAFAIILLLISISFQPVFAKDNILPKKKSDTKELLETILDIVNNKEIQNIIQKSEVGGSPLRFQQLLGKLQKEIIGLIVKNEVLNKRINQLSDLPCDCEKDNSTRLWRFPVICSFLFVLGFVVLWMVMHGNPWGEILGNLVSLMMDVLNCPL